MSGGLIALAVAATLVFIPLQSANAAVDLTPYVGASVPTRSLIMQTGPIIFRNLTHTVYGLGVGTTLSGRFGAELVAGVGSGKMEIVSTEIFSLGSTLLFADLRGKVRIAGGDRTNIGVVAGVGYTTQKIGLLDYAKRLGSGEFKGKLTGVVGLSVGAAVSDRLHLAVEVVDRIREQGIVSPGSTGLYEPTQHDVMITGGLSFPL